MQDARLDSDKQAAAAGGGSSSASGGSPPTCVADGAGVLAAELRHARRQHELLHVAPPLPAAEVAGLPARGEVWRLKRGDAGRLDALKAGQANWA